MSKFLSQNAVERRSLIHAWLVLIAVRTGLWVLPFRLLRRIVLKVPAADAADLQHSVASGTDTIRSVSRNIQIGSRYVPRASCLTQALSAQLLLARKGIMSTIHFGVSRTPGDPEMRAHAWLNCQGTTVTGGDVAANFVELSSDAMKSNSTT